ncbi:caspase family protein [Methylomonas sp. AM2-LC]|uniref:caspase family protein n=1 Tax=Methylomonas sp. AM2-LC TaxID=3153301 RepID=UPI003265527C
MNRLFLLVLLSFSLLILPKQRVWSEMYTPNSDEMIQSIKHKTLASTKVLDHSWPTRGVSVENISTDSQDTVFSIDNDRPDTDTAKRLALVIGNKDYLRKPLINPVNDARDMKAALEQVGFRVIYRENTSLLDLDNAVHEFVNNLKKESVGLVYYSGHAAQTDGTNYLIPVGIEIQNKSELKARAYDAGIILGEMQEIGNQINILILDACRNNPFKGFRGSSEGIVGMYGPKGSLIAYSTAPGSIADDNTGGRNGLYTSYLKKYLIQPGLTIEEMFKKVRESVINENNDQVPWENSSIIGDFCFAGCSKKDVTSLPVIASIETTKIQTCNFCPEMSQLPTGLQLGKYEITQRQWQAIMGNNPAKYSSCGDNCPVENVSWQDIQEFIKRLNNQTGKHYRLPTEEEWFVACQAGNTRKQFCDSDNLDDSAWYRGDSGSSTHPVGKKQANAWNLYDMTGNVWEWTSSCESRDCSRRYVRGGGWDGIPNFVRSNVRIKSTPSDHFINLGFRLALDQ